MSVFKMKLGAICGLIIGPVLLVGNYLETSEKKRIEREGIETIAIPSSKEEQRGRRGVRHYMVEIHYPVAGAVIRTAKAEISHDLYDKIDSNPVLKIRYLKESPARFIVVGEPLESPLTYYGGAVFFLFGIGGTWWFFIRKQPEAQIAESTNASLPSVPPAESRSEAQSSSLSPERIAPVSLPDNDDRYKPLGERKRPPSDA